MSVSQRGSLVELSNLVRRFGDVTALDGLNLTIQPGELVALLGPSGCGKTTALRLLAGLDLADSGNVIVDGKDLTNVPASQRDMGMVFQAYSLFPNMTALENVAFGLKVRGVDKDKREKKSQELLDLVGLTTQANRYSHQMSGGQQQRLCIARSLAVSPQVLLMDEPCSALDPGSTLRIEDTIRELSETMTIVIVTHNMQQAARVSDYTAFFLSDGGPGQMIEYAATSEIFSRPKDERTENYVTGRFG